MTKSEVINKTPPEPKAKSGGFDNRTPEEQLASGQISGQKVAAESEAELPPTNPYKDPNLNGISKAEPESASVIVVAEDTQQIPSNLGADGKPKPKKTETQNAVETVAEAQPQPEAVPEPEPVVVFTVNSGENEVNQQQLDEPELAADGKPKPKAKESITADTETQTESVVESVVEEQPEMISNPQSKSAGISVVEEEQIEVFLCVCVSGICREQMFLIG